MDAELAPFQGQGSGVDALKPYTVQSSTSSRAGRRDGRAHNEMRPISMLHAPLPQADGSARVQLGATQVLVAIYGPMDGPLTKQDPEALHVHIAYRRRDASTAGDSSVCSAEPIAARHIRLLVNDVLLTALYPRKALVVAVQILSDRGGVVAAAFNATMMALLDAGVPMRSFPVAANVAISNASLTVDPLLVEENEADATVTFVFDSSQKDQNAFLSVCTDGDCGGEHQFTAALQTCQQLADKTRAFLSLSMEKNARRRFIWNPISCE